MENKILEDKCQILIVGDSTVGKTSILYRYTNNSFLATHLATVGIDYFNKDEIINDKIIKVKIWDTAGQERYRSLTNSFFRNAQGIILVYDVSNRETFDNLKYWVQSINNNLGVESNVKKIILGNKIDLPREVSKDEAQAIADEFSIKYFETSAKDDINIKDSIRHCVEISCLEKQNTNNKNSNKINETKTPNADNKCC